MAWNAIIVFTLLIILIQREALDLPTFDEASLTQPGIQITLQSKLAIGSTEMSKASGPQSPEKLQAMENVAMVLQTPADQVRYAIMSAEIQGPDQAMATIEELRYNPHHYEITEAELADLDVLERIYTNQAIEPSQRLRLMDRHGWFGDLATSFNATESSDAHQNPRASGMRVMIIGILIVIGAIMLGLAGLVLFIIAIVMLSTGKVRPRFVSFANTRDTPILAESMAFFLAIFAVTGIISVYMISNDMADLSLVALAMLTLCPLAPLLLGIDFRRYRHLIGLHTGEGLFKEIGCGLLGYLSGLPIIVGAFIFSIVLAFLFPIEYEHPTVDPFSGIGPLGLVLLVSLLVVWAPLVEEILFRGIFYSHCRRWMPSVLAAIVTGVVFAAIHPQWIWFIPGLASVGVVFAMIREWRGSLVGSMAAHAFHNGMIACMLVALLLA